MLNVDGAWVWDFWLADDGERFHIYFLHAPTSLEREERRHRFARIGHAVSTDLVEWDVRESPFDVGLPGSFDQTATWTGCVVRGDDGLWRMFYTGSEFLGEEPVMANIETVGVATSADLIHWQKQPGPVVAADARWYETWGTSGWKEEAWRDPWVFRDPKGTGWHMLVTARANHGALDDRGVIGHAFSPDLLRWEVRPPLTAPGSGFAHLEVPQVTQVGGRWVLLFSATRDALSEAHADRIADPGTWAVMVDDPTRPFDVTAAQPLTTTDLYSGRLVDDRRGRPVFLAFRNADAGLPFVGGVTDPVPFTFDASGLPMLATTQAGRS